MPQKNTNRDDIATKLSLVNKIIRKGYDNVYTNISKQHKEYCMSIRNHNFFQLREQLMGELSPLVTHTN